jgi:hypothetical protein
VQAAGGTFISHDNLSAVEFLDQVAGYLSDGPVAVVDQGFVTGQAMMDALVKGHWSVSAPVVKSSTSPAHPARVTHKQIVSAGSSEHKVSSPTHEMLGFIRIASDTKASAAILKLSATDREKTEKIIEIINREDFIDRVSMTDTRSTVKSTDLISRGLLPASNVHKHSVVQGLASYPNGSLDTMAKIEDAIKEQIFKAEAPKRRLAEIKAKIQSRKM